MSHRGDDEGYHPHPGDPWHPAWSREAEGPEAEAPEAEAPEPEEPGEPALTPETAPRKERRRLFGRRRRTEETPAAEELPDLVSEDEGWPDEEVAGAALADWWAEPAPAPGDETPGEALGEAVGAGEASLGPVAPGERPEEGQAEEQHAEAGPPEAAMPDEVVPDEVMPEGEMPEGPGVPWALPPADEATASALAEPFAAARPAAPGSERRPEEMPGDQPRPPQWAPPMTSLPLEGPPPAGPPPVLAPAQAGPDLVAEGEAVEGEAVEGEAAEGEAAEAEAAEGEAEQWEAEQSLAFTQGTEVLPAVQTSAAEASEAAEPPEASRHRPPPWAPPQELEHRPPPWAPPEVPGEAAPSGWAPPWPGEVEAVEGMAPVAVGPDEEESAGPTPMTFEEDDEAAWEAWMGPAAQEPSREIARGPAPRWHPEPEPEPAAPAPEEEPEEGGWEAFPEPGMPLPRGARAPQGPGRYQPAGAPGPTGEAWEETWEREGEEAPAPGRRFAGAFEEPAARSRLDEPTAEIPQPYFFDFERPARRQGPITEEELAGAGTTEHRGLAEEIAAADTAETELQALSAPMPGLESGVVGFGDVAHLGGDEEFVAPGRSDLGIRVVTGMVLAAMLLGAMWVGGEFLAGFIGVLVVLGLGEFYGALRRSGYRPLALFGFLGGAGLLVGTWFHGLGAVPVAVVGTTVLTFFYYAFASRRYDALTNGGLTVLGMLWVTGTAAFAFPIAASEDFRVLVLAVAAAVVATDMGAFFAGRAWGSRLLAPVLSPHKTVEGLAGGVVAGIAAATAVGYFLDPLDIRSGAALGLVVAVMAPLGDLAESMLKRSLGIKDMGSLLPGHGGVVDRVDAFLFVLPACWVLFASLGLLH